MARIEASQEINAPARSVYDYFDDHNNIAEYMHGFHNFVWTTRTHEVGTRLKAESKSAGMTFPMELETTAVEPGRRIAGIFSQGMKGTWEWLFVPTEKGTKVSVTVDYELPMGILGQIADRLIVERENQANFEQSLATIKAKAEG